jgi:hypothetical protein
MDQQRSASEGETNMGTSRSIRLVVAALALSSSVAYAQDPAFTPATYPALTGARDAMSVDLNRDGWLDIATANAGRNAVILFINRGQTGGFDAPREIPVGAGPFDLSVGDVDRNGTSAKGFSPQRYGDSTGDLVRP